jgi:Transcriptional regulator PadR-like family
MRVRAWLSRRRHFPEAAAQTSCRGQQPVPKRVPNTQPAHSPSARSLPGRHVFRHACARLRLARSGLESLPPSHIIPFDNTDLRPCAIRGRRFRPTFRARLHGYGIAERLKQVSRDVLHVGESSLYPALQRLLLNGFVKAEWSTSDNNRRARYCGQSRTRTKRWIR